MFRINTLPPYCVKPVLFGEKCTKMERINNSDREVITETLGQNRRTRARNGMFDMDNVFSAVIALYYRNAVTVFVQ